MIDPTEPDRILGMRFVEIFWSFSDLAACFAAQRSSSAALLLLLIVMSAFDVIMTATLAVWSSVELRSPSYCYDMNVLSWQMANIKWQMATGAGLMIDGD